MCGYVIVFLDLYIDLMYYFIYDILKNKIEKMFFYIFNFKYIF